MTRRRLSHSCFLPVVCATVHSVSVALFVPNDVAAKPAAPAASGLSRVPTLQQSNYTDIRLSTPQQQLGKSGQQRAHAEALFIQGLVLEDTSSLSDALNAYTDSLQADPGTNPDLAIRIANEYVREGDVATGINLLKDLVKARPNFTVGYLNLSAYYLSQLKKPELALQYAQRAVQVAPGDLRSYEALFEVNFAMKHKKEAEQALQQAAKLNLTNGNDWLELSDLFIQLYTNPSDNTVPSSKESIIEPILKKAATLANGNADLYTKAGDNYVQLHDVRAAIPLYVKALELNKGNQELRYKLAQTFVKAGQRQEAIQTLEEIVRSNPMSPETYEFLGKLYDDNKNLPRALTTYQQALLLAPNDPQNYLRVADCQLRLQKSDAAIETLKQARIHFTLPQLTYALAIALSSAKQYNDALPVYEEALREAESSAPDVANSSFYFNYGVTAEQSGLTDKAVPLLQKSIELDPSRAALVYNYIGYMWVDRNMRLDEGGEMIKKALNLDPDNGAYLDSLGWYYYRKGEYGKSLVTLLKAVTRTKPDDPTIFTHVGDAYQASGKPAQAVGYWQKALRMDPKNQELQKKIKENGK
jgi:tetratricopeptide (TPR) repeat protein